MRINIVKYNYNWPTLFEIEKKILVPILPKNTNIEHIGSTAVEKLAAKPIIDILIGIQENYSLDNYVQAIQEKKYIYIKKYETELPFRRFFKKIIKKETTHHIHMVKLNSNWWKRHLSFRDYLRKNSVVAKQYESLKMKLRKQNWKDGNEYADAKTNFITTIEKVALEKK